ncbi:MAG TPA: ArsA-related P-loop ATPase, partial [Acidimicrobiales bacterium]|nr:ArsA-related P-loop ATPase [Acidimicrobiales bacterium]
MGPLTFFSRTRVLIVTGKGGVGKTTVSAVLANSGARQGLRVMVVQLGAPGSQREPESAHISRLFGHDQALDYDPIVLCTSSGGGEVKARAIRPDTALVEYLHLHGMRRLSRRLAGSGALDV